MLNLVLDSALLAIPNLGDENNDAIRIIDLTIELANLVNGVTGVQLILSELLESVLYGNSCAPDVDNVNQYLEISNLRGIYSPRDIVSAYQSIIDRSERTVSFGLAEVYNFSELEISPPITCAGFPAALAGETNRAFLTVAAAGDELAVGVVPSVQLTGNETVFTVTGIVSRFVGDEIDRDQLQAITNDIQVVRSPSALITQYWASVAWERAESANDLHLAIALNSLVLSLSSSGTGSASIKTFSVGQHFFSSLTKWQAQPTGKFGGATLDLCGKLVAGLTSRHLRHMHNAGGKIYRKHDGAKAMRVHLTDGHEGLRLLYWDDGQTIEFANVGDKDELLIIDGGSDAGAQVNLEAFVIN